MNSFSIKLKKEYKEGGIINKLDFIPSEFDSISLFKKLNKMEKNKSKFVKFEELTISEMVNINLSVKNNSLKLIEIKNYKKYYMIIFEY